MVYKRLHLALGLLLGVWLLPNTLCAQTTNISGVINIYTPVLAFGPCDNIITVSSSAGFAVGDTVLVIQMQGATINQTNSASYGTIASYNSAGFFEKAVIQGISANLIYFKNNLINPYNVGGRVQMVSVPVYQNANVTGALTGQPWNGSTGGVLILEVRGTLTATAGFLDMSAMGFRGGARSETCPNSCNFSQNNADYFYADPNYRGSMKGEGISLIPAGFERGRGAQANGAGGGNDHNSGGGGGGNLSAGGIGSRNNEPGPFLCKGYNPGEAGKALNSAAGTCMFMGGGGGAGHGNNFAVNGSGCTGGGGSSSGSAGGGIIIVMATTLNAAGVAFRTNSSPAGSGNGDGAGGGGAGGTVLLDVNSITASPFTIQATGGNGGSTFGFGQNRCYGPGGGGSGGAVFFKGASLPGTVTTTLTGGIPGTTLSTTNAGCLNTPGTATAGTAGITIPNHTGVMIGTLVAVEPCILPVEYASFTAQPGIQNSVRLDWQTTSELNNDHFEVEHSLNAIDFNPVGTVASLSSNGSGATYGFNHRSPVVGDNWYRIRQFDRDGRSSVGEIRQVRFEPNAITLQSLYPNPVNAPNEAIMELMLPGDGTGLLTISNMLGQKVGEFPLNLDAGLNTIRIPTQGLGVGIYFLRLNAGKHGELVSKLKIN